MTTVAPAEMCRLVVSGPERQIEIAVPAQVVIADLLPALVHHMGDQLADAGLGHGGWVLQRLGGPPLDEDGTVGSLGLADGTVVHLSPRADQIPPVHFDDLADGIATGMRGRSGLWKPEATRWASLGTLVVATAIGLIAVAGTGPTVLRAAAAAVLTVLSLAGAIVYARSFGDRPFGLTAALAAVAFATLTAMILPDTAAGTGRLVLGPPEIFAGCVVMALVAVFASVVVGRGRPLFAAIVAAGAGGAIGTAVAAFAGLSVPRSAAITVVLTTVITIAVPVAAFRLARIKLSPLPTKPEHLQEDIDPEPSEDLLARTARADRYMTGLHAGLAAPATAAMVLVALDGGWAAYTLTCLAALARLLGCRPMTSAWHRLAMAIPAIAGLATVAVVSLAEMSPLVRLPIVLGGVPPAAVLLFALSRYLPGRRLMPIWGRIGDLTQVLATVALLPVLAALLGLYGAARALGG